MNLTSREAELRTAAYDGVTGPDKRCVSDIFVAESDDSLMAEVHSSANKFDKMADIVSGVLRGLSSEGESVHVIYVGGNRMSKIDADSDGFEDMSECQQRLHVAHSLRLGDN
ncbi:hypothetical protein MUK72_09185 [Halococcus dombrowskii]|uniref:Uncharacterized protein n=1 Tax=Halococcus dombrowskii TaxID=179637 RepID=A0AAV3SC56_HALDO|nr:hypothetical protein [Halococcus dombrowskii]UOO94143.1 hypothetical protein MUK72_09185 [Halococcus dombrowskii]